ncbi:serine hydrolase [Chitinophaga sp. SYP-B3965]|uniref:serine hydrolase domain-containing protein n=1 Tax=Chitinophaga sp. SYP-B3965 TaxID=2663120 RepID=UPI001299B1FD|nr:serine hydrolase domain-containing protein [Chitinophaga sp. SYP-B3965]MRG44859.1 serine hydrolase [Chitinophaga sp. SYP-B3965]
MNIKLLIASLLTFTATHAQTFDKAKLDQYFDRLAEKNKAMGTLVISKDGKQIYTRSIGYGQITETTKKPLTAESRYRIASITKMYTAAMILQLVEEGKLQLTDTIGKFFPQIANAGKITIAHILAHRSGIHDVLVEPDVLSQVKAASITKEELVAIVCKGKSDFEPGTKHQYSNSGYALLGVIVEKLSGQSYAEALRKRITAKIGLKDTYIATAYMDVNKNESLTYRYTGGWLRQPETPAGILFGAGSIISTPADMAQFIHALFSGKFISPEHLTLMKTIKDGDGSGMEPFLFAGKTFYGHTGGGGNLGAWLAYMPEEKLAVAYTTNAKVHPVADIMKSIMEIYYNKPFEIPTFEAMVISEEILEKYTGVYATTEAPVKFTITRNGGTLYIKPPGEGSPAPLEATASNKFNIQGVNGVTFEFDVAKKQMIMNRVGVERIFTKEN